MGRYESGNSGGAASAASSGTNFNAMPMVGSSTSGNVPNLAASNIWVKNSEVSASQRTASTFFGNITLANNMGTHITGASAANTWYTLVATTGTKGKLFHVIPPIGASAGANITTRTDVEVTIDGVVHTYYGQSSNYLSGYATWVLGAIHIGSTPSTTYSATSASQLDVQGLIGSYNDTGLNGLYYTQCTIPSPTQSLFLGLPYLQWTTDMQVRVRSTTATSTSILGNYSAALFITE